MDEQTVTIESPHFPPPAPPVTPKPRWYQLPVARDPDDHKLGGVIGGLSRTYGFDVRTTRIAVAVATIVLPVLALVYIAAWVLLPDRPEEATSLEAIARDRRRIPLYLAVGLVIFAGGLGSFGSWFFLGGLPWGLGLIAVGVLLWAAPSLGRSKDDPTAPMPPSGAPVPAAGWTAPAHPTGTSSGTATAPAADRITTVRPANDPTTQQSTSWAAGRPLQIDDVRTRRVRYPIASLVLLSVLSTAAVVGVGDALDWWDVPVLTVLVVSLVGIAGGIVASAIVNRSWVPVTVLPFVTLAAVGLLIAQPNLDGGVGERTVVPTSISAAGRTQQLAIGELTIDLSQPLDASTAAVRGEQVDVRAEVGIGHLEVIVPAGAVVIIEAEIGAGDVLVDGSTIADGIRHSDQRTITPQSPTPDAQTFHLDVEVGTGRIDITRV